MFCNCGHDTKVIDTRYDERANVIIRRRECLKCGDRFTTTESQTGVQLPPRKKSRPAKSHTPQPEGE